MIRTVGILTLLYCAASVCAQTGTMSRTGSPQTFVSGEAASLQIKGRVTVNQRLIEQATTVIAEGDRVETGDLGAARISAAGLSVYLPAKSCLAYGKQQLEVCNCGSLQVSALEPVSVVFRDRDLVVSSQDQNGAFAISVAGSDLKVVSQKGTTNVVSKGAVLSQIRSDGSQSLAGLGCRTTVNNFNSAAGAAAAIATPAAIAGIVIWRTTNRQPVSSIAP